MTDTDVRRLALIGCTSQKRNVDDPIPAELLYDESDYFEKRKTYSDAYCDDFVVLSALHHVLFPDDEIEPYDKSLSAPASADNGMTREEKAEWGEETLAQLNEISWDEYDEVHALVGQSYLEWIREGFQDIPAIFVYPFEGHSGIGKQKTWLKEKNAEADPVIAEDQLTFQEF